MKIWCIITEAGNDKLQKRGHVDLSGTVLTMENGDKYYFSAEQFFTASNAAEYFLARLEKIAEAIKRR